MGPRCVNGCKVLLPASDLSCIISICLNVNIQGILKNDKRIVPYMSQLLLMAGVVFYWGRMLQGVICGVHA